MLVACQLARLPRLAHTMRASNDAQCGNGRLGRLSIASAISRQRSPERPHLVSELLLLAHAGKRRVDMHDVASGNRHRGYDILADAEHQRHDGERFMLG